LPRKTEANDPADWFWLAEADLEMVRTAVEREISYPSCRGKLAEVLEKVLKGELIRLGWPLEKTHDLERLLDALVERKSDLTPHIEPLCDSLAEVYFSSRYPGFDLEDSNWPGLRHELEQVSELLTTVKQRLIAPS
jgi:HEPN domain-containing protein